MNRLKSLKKNTIFSIAEVVLNGIGLFFIYKNVVSSLGVKMLGVWSLVLATTAFGRLADVGISAGLARFVARELAKDNPDAVTTYVQTAMISVAGIMGILTLIAYWPIYFALKIALSGSELELARSIIPFALLTFWMLNLNSVTAASLLGLHRADLRSISNIFGMLVQVATSLVLVKSFQLMGLAWAQTAQYVVAISISWFFITRVHRAMPIVPLEFSRPVFKELLGFGTKLQIGTIANLLFEPTTKIIIGHIGGTAVLGVFELAYRMVYQVRGIAVTALQNLVPAFANLKETDSSGLTVLFKKTCKVAAILSAPIMCAVTVGSPIIAIVWTGHYNPLFVEFSALLALTWTVNILAAPAYFLGLGTGSINMNVIGQVVTGFISPILGFTIGLFFGGVGAVIGVSLGKVIGDLIPAFANRPEKHFTSSALLYKPNLVAIATVAGVCSIVYALAAKIDVSQIKF
ncbi:oligosaccharide flippase family protein [Asticcacaulis benevestitus]|uniref:Polysaccharide biosynthesis protein C-terminal domain-containing protein n=1 Tax=Asticcacaulis benevestitus DSM 16100 = ATCC BAA-896 TaxID=1121022 RepID=V4P652_9CAUL|nr:oligosaccharide flippase family protein [Asticcacaulis benevestitus]ESQ89442.1 hypothetical protein ABENE_13770 [Asticcacaulis benevestitus DSM 16100 = ATCC BAA-896]